MCMSVEELFEASYLRVIWGCLYNNINGGRSGRFESFCLQFDEDSVVGILNRNIYNLAHDAKYGIIVVLLQGNFYFGVCFLFLEHITCRIYQGLNPQAVAISRGEGTHISQKCVEANSLSSSKKAFSCTKELYFTIEM